MDPFSLDKTNLDYNNILTMCKREESRDKESIYT